MKSVAKFEQPTMIDLFSGSGGVTQGFKTVGYKVLASVEYDEITAKSYKENHPEVTVYNEDIRWINPSDLMRNCHLEPGQLTVLSVCAPCQPFSKQNKSEAKDSRTRLLLQTVRFAQVLQPQVIFIENVPGLLKGKNRRILDILITRLREELNYNVSDPQIVNAADYGVPQHRQRLIVIATKEGHKPLLPAPTHGSPKYAETKGVQPWITVRQAFNGIHRLASGKSSKSDTLHKARQHKKIVLQRIAHIPKNGGSRKSLPDHLQLNCHKKSNGFNDVYGRMDFSKPANTLTTGCTNLTKGRYIHPTANRAITPREAARLQTFPDDYVFLGNYEQISTQIGNAVPVRLAEAFGNHIRQIVNQ